jgi:ATP-dependent DNA ligase
LRWPGSNAEKARGRHVAVDESGRPSFDALQNYGSNGQPVLYYVFDVLMLSGNELIRSPLENRGRILEEEILPHLVEPVRHTPFLNARLSDLIQSVKSHGLEGIVAKRADSFYEPGVRSLAWQKMRGEYVRERGAVVSVFYVSNVEMYPLCMGQLDPERGDAARQ